MPIDKVVFLDRDDLNVHAVDKKIEEIGFGDFNIERTIMEKANLVVFLKDDRMKVIKSRFSSLKTFIAYN